MEKSYNQRPMTYFAIDDLFPRGKDSHILARDRQAWVTHLPADG